MNISNLQQKLSTKAQRSDTYHFYQLYQVLYDANWLRMAYERIARSEGAHTAGCDGITISDFNMSCEQNLESIALKLEEGDYKPKPSRRVYIPKANGKKRPLGILTIADRIVQEAIRMVLEPIFEPGFSEYSFGYRRNLGVRDAIDYLSKNLNPKDNKSRPWIIEGDITACFDNIRHNTLHGLLRRRIADTRLLGLIDRFLRAGHIEYNRTYKGYVGVPQGGIISPLLANIYLHEMDMFLENAYIKTQTRHIPVPVGYVRYADDFAVLCANKRQAEEIRHALSGFLASSLHLELSLAKTKITHLSKGFIFLGFGIDSTGDLFSNRVRLQIPKEAYESIKEKIQRLTSKNTIKDSIEFKLTQLSRVISSWCSIYQHTDNAIRVFKLLDKLVIEQMCIWLATKNNLKIKEVKKQFITAKSVRVGKNKIILPSQRSMLPSKSKPALPSPKLTSEVF